MGNKDTTFLLERRAALLKQQFDMMEQVQEIDRLLEDAKPKWNPEGGDWWITSNNDIVPVTVSINCEQATLFGARRPTEQQAERAAVEMRKFNRLLALRDELCGDDEVDFNDSKFKYYVYFSHADKSWHIDCNDEHEVIMPYFTSIESAQKACDMLNSGEVEL
jgi:hypothetical protein